MRLRGVVSALFAISALLCQSWVPSAMAAAESCRFVLGFQTLHDDMAAIVGACADDQTFAANGDALQHTAAGMLVWRKSDNFTAFTNGYWTWVNGPYGVQRRLNGDRFSWEHNPVVSDASSSSTSTTTSGGSTVTVTNSCSAQGSSGSVSATGLNGSTTVVSSDGVTTTSVSNNSSSSSSPGTATASCQHS